MKLLCGVAVTAHGDARPCYLHDEMSMAAWRYFREHDKVNDKVVTKQKRVDIKVYRLHAMPSNDEEVFIFSVDSKKLKRWIDLQPAI